MQRSRQQPAPLRLRVLIVDGHEVSRGASAALLRTEGLYVTDVPPDRAGIGLARSRAPEIVVIDAALGAAVLRELAGALRALARPPAIVLTSSADQDQLDECLAGFSFVGKADICAQALVEAATDESTPRAESE
jgi:CheY-like chemotaxis protein